MTTDTLNAVLAFFGSISGTVLGIVMSARLTAYRIKQLETRVDKHNQLVERTFRLEGRVDALEDKCEVK